MYKITITNKETGQEIERDFTDEFFFNSDSTIGLNIVDMKKRLTKEQKI